MKACMVPSQAIPLMGYRLDTQPYIDAVVPLDALIARATRRILNTTDRAIKREFGSLRNTLHWRLDHKLDDVQRIEVEHVEEDTPCSTWRQRNCRRPRNR